MRARDYLTVKQASAYSTLSVVTLRRLIRDGRLPVARPTPRRVVIARRQLDDLLAGGTKE
jgi:excisionase family DNA binding protein